jgi:hypothetical protein
LENEAVTGWFHYANGLRQTVASFSFVVLLIFNAVAN